MQEKLRGYYTKVSDKWSALEKGQQIRLAATVLILLITLIATIFLVTRPKWVVLVSGKDVTTIGKFETALNAEGIKTNILDNSTAIAVQEQDKDRSLIVTASNKELSAINFTYADALDASGIGTTESIRQQNFKKLAESELAGTISSMNGIDHADVYLNLPNENNFFVDFKAETSASVMLYTNQTIDESTARTIARFVASSVKGLELENIQIADTHGNTLYSGNQSGDGSSNDKLNLRLQLENQLSFLIRAALYDKFDDINVVPNLEINWDEQEVTTREVTSPVADSNSGLIARERTLNESATGTTLDGEPGINENDQATTNYEVGDNMESSASRKSIERDFELNEMQRRVIAGTGNLLKEASSFAVYASLIRYYDEAYLSDNNLLGGRTWDDYKSEIKNEAVQRTINVDPSILEGLKTGTGIDRAVLIVSEIPVFRDREVTSPNIEQIVLFVILALLILLLALGLIRKARADEVTEVEPELSVEDLLVSTQLEDEKAGDAERADALQDIEFNSESEAKRQIEKFIMEKPDAVAHLLRNWLNEEWE